MWNDQLGINFSLRDQLFAFYPSVEDSPTVNGVQRQTFEYNIIQKVLHVQRMAMQSNEYQLSSLEMKSS